MRPSETINQPRGTACRINTRSIDMQEENRISETDAEDICNQLGE
ncbi:hypothetical protein [Neisseria mucosa]|nr:hypothetical protein [Neisseria mucosa]